MEADIPNYIEMCDDTFARLVTICLATNTPTIEDLIIKLLDFHGDDKVIIDNLKPTSRIWSPEKILENEA